MNAIISVQVQVQVQVYSPNMHKPALRDIQDTFRNEEQDGNQKIYSTFSLLMVMVVEVEKLDIR